MRRRSFLRALCIAPFVAPAALKAAFEPSSVEAVRAPPAATAARYAVRVDADGYAMGIRLISGEPSEMTITVVADKFEIAFPRAGSIAKYNVVSGPDGRSRVVEKREFERAGLWLEEAYASYP